MGARRRPGTASGAAADRPLPRAPSGDPTKAALEGYNRALVKQTCWHSISGLGCWIGSKIPEPEILGKVSGTVQNVLKSRITRK